MRVCRFEKDRVGIVIGGEVLDITYIVEAFPVYRYPLPQYDPLIAHLGVVQEQFEQILTSAPRLRLDNVILDSPIANPGKIIAAPVNYRDHVDEMLLDPAIDHHLAQKPIAEVGLFLKATSSLIGPSDPILIRDSKRRTDYEVELAVIIGKDADRVSRECAMDYVAGYCIGLDITTRGPEDRSMRKSSDTFTVMGPWMVTADELDDPSNLDITLSLNGFQRQNSNTKDLIMDVPALISFASSFYTLRAGDVILTGTPAGVGPLQIGDQIVSHIQGIGEMATSVAS